MNQDAKKSVGAEGISSIKLLKLSAPVLAEEITRLINHCIPNQCWPSYGMEK